MKRREAGIRGRICKCLGLLAAVIFFGPALRAAQSDFAGGSLSGSWLNVQANPRAAALAGASSALADDLSGLGINPAALAWMRSGQLNLGHNFWILDLSQERLAAGLPLAGGTAGLGLDYLDLGSIDAFSVGANNIPQSQGSLRPYAMALNLTWAQPLWSGLAWGASAKLVAENLASPSTAPAADLGMQWKARGTALTLAAALDNLGGSLDGASLPAVARLGAAYAVAMTSPSDPVWISAEIEKTMNAEENPVVSVGEEAWIRGLLALRAGYQFGNGLVGSGPAAGVGLRLGWLQLDYAYDARGALGASQQIALTAALPSPPLAAPLPEATDARVIRQVRRMVEAMDRGDTLAAQDATRSLLEEYQPARRLAARQLQQEVISSEVFKGEFEEAEKALKVMVSLDHAGAYSFEALAAVEWHLGRPAAALEYLKRASLLEPDKEYLKNKIKQLGGEIPADKP